jgi:hypothetical protein
MNPLREVMQQALETLNFLKRGMDSGHIKCSTFVVRDPDATEAEVKHPVELVNNDIAAISAALAEPDHTPDAGKKVEDLLSEYDMQDSSFADDLRAALAEPEPYDQQALELCKVCGWKTLIPTEGCLNCERQPKAEPQKPVGWLYEGIAPHTREKTVFQKTRETRIETRWWREVGRVYTAPQPRRRLTDDEILNIGEKARAVEGQHMLPVTFARAIEAAVWGDGK